MSRLNIKISGKIRSGKSTVARVIEEALRSKGFDVDFYDDDYGENIYHEDWNFSERIDFLKDRTNVVINQETLNRDMVVVR